MNQPAIQLSQTLLQQLVVLLERDIDDAARARARLHLLDWLGCVAYGSRSEVADKLRQYLSIWGSSGSSWSMGEPDRSWQDALLLNAALGNVAEMDDLHRTSILHPGPVVVPAAVTVAELVGATPVALLDAIVIGYEAMIRIGRALGPDHYALYHNTSTCGGFGAAAATAHLLGLDRNAFVSALANAGSRTGGLWQLRHEAVDTKQLHNAGAAHSGVLAALLAQADVRGPASLLEGSQGFFAATSPMAQPLAVVDNAGDSWQIFQCSFKPWPACRHAHAAIDAVRALGDLDPSAVESVRIRTYRDALLFCDKPEPRNAAEARFSLQHCAAVSLLFGRPEIRHFEGEYLHRTDVVAMRGKIFVAIDEQMDRAYPSHFGAFAAVLDKAGHEREIRVRDAWGDPEQPMSETDINAKARALMCVADLHERDIDAVMDFTTGLTQAGAQLAPWLRSLRALGAGK